FSGGEPTLQSELPAALQQAAELGFEVALHSNGHDPAALQRALDSGALDFVALDVKAPFDDYAMITQIPASGAGARASVRLVLASGIAHELRTTWHPALLSREQLRTIARELAGEGARAWVLQLFRPEGCPVRWLRESIALPARVDEELRAELTAIIPGFAVRGADST
ncbi:MAG: anaerobic ribonucleoside-triphosphate reductase activating protein, partial [Armatimonadota bacterium]